MANSTPYFEYLSAVETGGGTAWVGTISDILTLPAAGEIYVGGVSFTSKTIVVTNDAKKYLSKLSSAIIKGIQIEICIKASALDSDTQLNVQARKNGVDITPIKSATTIPIVYTYATFGGETDLWNTTWTIADLIAANTGFIFNVSNADGINSRTFYVPYVRGKIFYEPRVAFFFS